nr:MAG TPA: hypothetical protein [Caudoviricetes sp.]DAT72562.1 MAG TPA: hypothetical protein [Caudoviricetes sp.]DAW44099.1 MAG TPA: hypothetical protein [Caudoviricetes sp.]
MLLVLPFSCFLLSIQAFVFLYGATPPTWCCCRTTYKIVIYKK